jgi:hypothetical protein
VFLQSAYKVLIESWRDRGTRWIGTAILSPFTKLIAGTGAVSWYKVERSDKTITVYEVLIWADERIRVQQLAGSRHKGTVCKNRDKLINPTVRVISRLLPNVDIKAVSVWRLLNY